MEQISFIVVVLQPLVRFSLFTVLKQSGVGFIPIWRFILSKSIIKFVYKIIVTDQPFAQIVFGKFGSTKLTSVTVSPRSHVLLKRSNYGIKFMLEI